MILNKNNIDVLYVPNFFSEVESSGIFSKLNEELQLEPKVIIKNDIPVRQKRLVAWYSESDINSTFYSYTDIAKPLTPLLKDIKRLVELRIKNTFNGVLVNYYKDGLDEIGWHSDDTKELGEQPVIASVSFGASRIFRMKHKFNKEIGTHDLLLENGSLLVMKGETQSFWEHSLPVDKDCHSARINLTFRKIQIL